MTYEEAKKIIDPKTTTEAYVECYMSSGAVMSAEIWKAKVDEACEIAAEALEKQIPKKPIKYKGEIVCPSCKTLVGSAPYCRYCGCALDWSEVDE